MDTLVYTHIYKLNRRCMHVMKYKLNTYKQLYAMRWCIMHNIYVVV